MDIESKMSEYMNSYMNVGLNPVQAIMFLAKSPINIMLNRVNIHGFSVKIK
jgi:hypothetical protein